MDIKELKNLTILFADDDPIMRASLGNSLSLMSKNVILAANGLEAARLYRENDVHIVILDISMPHKSGLDVAKEIRESDKNIPIVLLTAYEDLDNLHAAIKLHLVDYLVKPIDFNSLLKVLKECTEALKNNGMLFLQIDDSLIYNSVEKVFIKCEEKITLTRNEVVLVELLLKNRGAIVSYDAIGHELNYISKDAIKNAFMRIRKKIGFEYIQNIFDLGYQFR